MRMRIFSCNHVVPTSVLDTPLFVTLVSNIAPDQNSSFLSDLNGQNIAGDNSYAELRHQFYVWKNLLGEFDYVGFEHYRRPFFIDPLPIEELVSKYPAVTRIRTEFATSALGSVHRNSNDFNEYNRMRAKLTDDQIAEITQYFKCFDIIAPIPENVNIIDQWNKFHDSSWYPILLTSIREAKYLEKSQAYFPNYVNRCYWFNSYIMRAEFFAEYMDFVFSVLSRVNDSVPGISKHQRPLGHFSERIFSLWLAYKKISSQVRVLELPLLFHNTGLDIAT